MILYFYYILWRHLFKNTYKDWICFCAYRNYSFDSKITHSAHYKRMLHTQSAKCLSLFLINVFLCVMGSLNAKKVLNC